jgi:hypothetical protein
MSTECFSMFYIVGGLKNRHIVVSKRRAECFSMFYIVGKAEKQAKRWKLKVAQSA